MPLIFIGAGKDIVVGVKAAPAVVAALPFDEQIFFVRNGAKLIRAGTVVKPTEKGSLGPAYLLVAGDGLLSIDKGTAAVWQEAELFPEQVGNRSCSWIKQFFGLTNAVCFPLA